MLMQTQGVGDGAGYGWPSITQHPGHPPRGPRLPFSLPAGQRLNVGDLPPTPKVGSQPAPGPRRAPCSSRFAGSSQLSLGVWVRDGCPPFL